MSEEQTKAQAYVQQWFCHNNEILWERGGHYKEEVAALLVLLREATAKGLEDGIARTIDKACEILLNNPHIYPRVLGEQLTVWCCTKAQQARRGHNDTAE